MKTQKSAKPVFVSLKSEEKPAKASSTKAAPKPVQLAPKVAAKPPKPVAPKAEPKPVEPAKVEEPTSGTFSLEAQQQYKDLSLKMLQLKQALADDLMGYRLREQTAIQTMTELQKTQDDLVRSEVQKLGLDPQKGPLKLDLQTFQVTRQA